MFKPPPYVWHCMPQNQNLKNFIYFFPLFGVLACGIFRSLNGPVGDFGNYFFGALLFYKEHLSPKIYDPIWFNQVVENLGFTSFFGCFSPFPPTNALLLVPFLGFEPTVAKAIFLILISTSFFTLIFRWFKIFEIPFWVALIIPIVLFKPIQSNLIQGQVYFGIFILLVEGLIAFQKRQTWLCTLLWGLAILFKIFPLILLVMFLERQRIKDLKILIPGFAFLLSLFVSIQGWEIWSHFFFTILPGAASGEVIDRFSFSHQSWNSLFSHLFLNDEAANPEPVFPSVSLYIFSLALIKSVILGFSIWSVYFQKNLVSSFGFLVLSGILLLPTGPTYALVSLLFVLILLFQKNADIQILHSTRWLLIGVLYLSCNFPFNTLQNWPLLIKFSRLFLLGFLWIFCLPKSSFNMKSIGLTLLLFLAQVWAMGQMEWVDDSSKSISTGVRNGLLISFKIQKNRLILTYRDQNGVHEINTDFPIQSAYSQKVSLDKNKILLNGIPVSTSPDKKKSPAFINGNAILYLSEKNQGFGFYSLRLLTLSHENLVQ